MLKKILSVVLSIAMIFTLFACGSNSSISSDGSSSGGSNSSLRAQIENCTPLVDYSGNTIVEQMDTITFGLDENSNPIEWLVLEKNNNKALLLSKFVLLSKVYHYAEDGTEIDITWSDSDIRKYLNSELINSIFSKKEQGLILITDVINNDNVEYGTKGGNSTKDKLFLLSIDEFNKYFKSEKQAVTTFSDGDSRSGDSDSWWLRSPGGRQSSAASVRFGFLDTSGYSVNCPYYTVRPAMWVKY